MLARSQRPRVVKTAEKRDSNTFASNLGYKLYI